MWVRGWQLTTACAADLRSRVTVGRERTHDQDPLYGLRLLGEIAAKALSPGVNDIGLAREVIAHTVILLAEWIDDEPHAPAGDTGVFVKPVADRDVVGEALGPVAREGAGNLELQIELQTALFALHTLGDDGLSAAARELSELGLHQALPRTGSDRDRARLTAAAALLAGASG
jgi:uncharacterized membrane protein